MREEKKAMSKLRNVGEKAGRRTVQRGSKGAMVVALEIADDRERAAVSDDRFRIADNAMEDQTEGDMTASHSKSDGVLTCTHTQLQTRELWEVCRTCAARTEPRSR
jgi:hypothetical protein